MDQRFVLTLRHLCVLGLVSAISFGCMRSQTGLESRPSRSVAAAPLLNAGADHHEWVKRLLVTPAVAEIQQVAATTDTVLPIPISASAANDGVGYALVVNQQSGLVWLRSHDLSSGLQQATHGPWKTDQADAAHLLRSLTTAGQ